MEITPVEKNNRFGIINRDGKSITGFRYDYIGDFHEGMAAFEKMVSLDFSAYQVNRQSRHVLKM